MTNDKPKWESHQAGDLIVQTLVWPDGYWPVIVQGGKESLVLRRSWRTRMPVPMSPVGVWTFIGLDRGDIVEADIDVYGPKGIPLAHRSMHKEGMISYDAWRYCPIGAMGALRRIRLDIVCRVNGINEHLGNRLSARVHYGLQIVGFVD